MRLPPVLVFAGCMGLIALACGGATEQDVLSEPSASSSSTSSSGAATASSSSGATTSGSSGTTTSGSSGAPTSSSGSSSGGVKNPTACTQEKELNNEPGQANTLVDSVCGTLLPVSELDYLTFVLPEDARTMDLNFSGDVKLRISVEGENPVELSPTSKAQVPFAPGKQYVIRVSAASAGAIKVDWRVDLDHT